MVRCADCGLLANEESGGIVILTDRTRGTAGRCLVDQIDMRKFASENHSRRPYDPDGALYIGLYSDDWAAVFREERECVRWVRWEPGRTPKEHLDVDLRQELAHIRREQRLLTWVHLGLTVVAVGAAVATATAAFVK